jgi:hypothetical protein
VVAGLSCWDRATVNQSRRWLITGGLLLATGLATKLSLGFVLIPAVACLRWPTLGRRLGLAALMLVPAILWYAWARVRIESTAGLGSNASADNAAIWIDVLRSSATALWSVKTARHAVRFLLIRGYTPLGVPLDVWGLWPRSNREGVEDVEGGMQGPWLWWVWGGAALAALGLLAAKLHHEYYWQLLAPVIAAGVGRSLGSIERRRSAVGLAAALIFAASCLAASASTWTSPPEWRDLDEASRMVQAEVPEGAWLVAPEALLFQADRRGCRLEFDSEGVRRAAGEWEESASVTDSAGLVAFYREQGARYFADVGPVPKAEGASVDARRVALHELVRRRYKVKVDRPSVIIAELEPIETPRNGN